MSRQCVLRFLAGGLWPPCQKSEAATLGFLLCIRFGLLGIGKVQACSGLGSFLQLLLSALDMI